MTFGKLVIYFNTQYVDDIGMSRQKKTILLNKHCTIDDAVRLVKIYRKNNACWIDGHGNNIERDIYAKHQAYEEHL